MHNSLQECCVNYQPPCPPPHQQLQQERQDLSGSHPLSTTEAATLCTLGQNTRKARDPPAAGPELSREAAIGVKSCKEQPRHLACLLGHSSIPHEHVALLPRGNRKTQSLGSVPDIRR